MKVVIKNKSLLWCDKRNVTLRLREETIKIAGKAAHDNNISRQKLLESIVEQALNDKNFVLKI